MLDGLVDEARRRWGLEPERGLQVVAADALVGIPIEPTIALIVVPASGGVGAMKPVPGRHGPRGQTPVEVIWRLYPADHRVGRFGTASETTVAALSPEELAAGVYLAPVAAVDAFGSPWGMPAISARLREPDGCPLDREQTHLSLRNHLLEEAYEVYDALSDPATPALAGELGDLWLQIVLHAQLAAEEGVFDLADVEAAIASKIVRRHPHVFGDAEARTASDVNRQWERIKAAERAEASRGAEPLPSVPPRPGGADGETGRTTAGAMAAGTTAAGALDGISRSLPALAASQEMQERAANIGYDWPTIDGVLGKVSEEIDELRAAATPDERAEELGDLLFVLVNVARRLDVEAEAALRAANDKFRRRFGVVERLAAERSVALRDLSFEQLDELWDRAKLETAR